MLTSSDNEKAVTIAISLLKHKSPKNVQILKNLLTFIPNPNHIKAILKTAVIEIVHSCPQSALWLFQHAEVLEPEIQAREVIVQELTNTLHSWGYPSDEFQVTDDQHLAVSEATKLALLSHQPSSMDTAALTLIRLLLSP